MVRNVKHVDESESDWDSVSEAEPASKPAPPPPPQTTPPPPPPPATPFDADVATDASPLYSEIIKPNGNVHAAPRSLVSVGRSSTDEGHGQSVADEGDVEPATALHPPLQRLNRRLSPVIDGFDNVAFEDCHAVIRSNGFNTTEKASYKLDGRLAMAAAMGLEAPETTAPTPPASRAPADDAVSIFRFERADIEFYQVAEARGPTKAGPIGDVWFRRSRRFWAEVTAVLGLPFVLLLAFILELLRFATVGLVRPLVVGLMTGVSDGLLKPVLTSLFNALVQPTAVFFHQSLTAVNVNLVAPLADMLALLLNVVARLLQSFRLVQVHQHQHAVSTV